MSGLMERADRDGDGAIDRKEFLLLMAHDVARGRIAPPQTRLQKGVSRLQEALLSRHDTRAVLKRLRGMLQELRKAVRVASPRCARCRHRRCCCRRRLPPAAPAAACCLPPAAPAPAAAAAASAPHACARYCLHRCKPARLIR